MCSADLRVFLYSSSLSCGQNHRPPLYQHEWAPQNVFVQTRRNVLSKMIPFWALIIAGKCPCPSLGPFWNQDHGLITPGSDSDHINVCHIKGFCCFCWLEFSHLICLANSKDLDRYQKTAEVSAEPWFDWRNCSFNRFEHQKDWKSLLFTPLRSKTCLHRAKHKQTRLPCQKVTDRFLSSSSPGCIQQSARTQLYFFVALLSPYRQKHSYHNISSSGIHKLRKTKLLIHFSGPCLKNTCSFQSRPA